MKPEEMAAWLAAIVESTDDAIIGKNLEGTILSWNSGATNLYGFTREEALGKPISIIVPSERENELPMIFDQLRKGKRVDQFETTRMRKDGRIVPVSVRISPVLSHQGVVIGASALARDISEELRTKAERESLIKDLTKALDDVTVLRGLLPICAWCKKIRDDRGSWIQVETYIRERSEAEFTHGICPECARKMASESR